MQQPILIIGADKSHCVELRNILEDDEHTIVCSDSIINLGTLIDRTGCHVLILDLDALPIDNRVLRDLKRKNPRLSIIGLSARPFHPELKEAMADYIYACLCRPVDPDELIYWIKTIHGNASSLEHHSTED
jgi:DNA-binding NtrC family response regulator